MPEHKVSSVEICPDCHGEGEIFYSEDVYSSGHDFDTVQKSKPCERCKQTGRIKVSIAIDKKEEPFEKKSL